MAFPHKWNMHFDLLEVVVQFPTCKSWWFTTWHIAAMWYQSRLCPLKGSAQTKLQLNSTFFSWKKPKNLPESNGTNKMTTNMQLSVSVASFLLLAGGGNVSSIWCGKAMRHREERLWAGQAEERADGRLQEESLPAAGGLQLAGYGNGQPLT